MRRAARFMAVGLVALACAALTAHGVGLRKPPSHHKLERVKAASAVPVELTESQANAHAMSFAKLKSTTVDYAGLNNALDGAEGFIPKKDMLPPILQKEEHLGTNLDGKIAAVDSIYTREHEVDKRRERDSKVFDTDSRKVAADGQRLKQATAANDPKAMEAAMTQWETDSTAAQKDLVQLESEYDEARELMKLDKQASREADGAADELWAEHTREKQARRNLQAEVDVADTKLGAWSQSMGLISPAENQQRSAERERLRVDEKTKDPLPVDGQGLAAGAAGAAVGAGVVVATAAAATPAPAVKQAPAPVASTPPPPATAVLVTAPTAAATATAPAGPKLSPIPETTASEKQLYALLDMRESSPELTAKWPEAYDAGKQCEFEGVVCSADKSVIEISIEGVTALKFPGMEDFNALTKVSVVDSSITFDSMGAANLAKATSLTTLVLRNCKLSSIPPSLSGMKALTDLDLSQNSIDSIPSAAFSLPALQRLYLTHNMISTLDGASSAAQLQELYVAENAIKTIPALPAVTILDASKNKLAALPNAIFSSQLRILRIAHNELTTIPATVGSAGVLEELDVSFNRIDSIPTELGSVASLKVLLMSNNDPLSQLPSTLGDRSLDRLSVDMQSIHPEGELTAAEGTFLGAIFHNQKLNFIPLTNEKTPEQLAAETSKTGCLYKGVERYPGVTVFVCGDHEAIQLLADPTEVVEPADCQDENVELSTTPIAELANKEERILGVVHGEKTRCFDIMALHKQWQHQNVPHGQMSEEDTTRFPPNFMQRYEDMLVAYMKKYTDDPNTPRVPVEIADAAIECKNGDEFAGVEKSKIIGWRIDPPIPGTEDDPKCRTDCFNVDTLKSSWASNGDGTNPLFPGVAFAAEFVAMAKRMMGEPDQPQETELQRKLRERAERTAASRIVKPEPVSNPKTCSDYYPADIQAKWEAMKPIEKIGLTEGGNIHCYSVLGLNTEWSKPESESSLAYGFRPDNSDQKFPPEFTSLLITKVGMLADAGEVNGEDSPMDCVTPKGCVPVCLELSTNDCPNRPGCSVQNNKCRVECNFINGLKAIGHDGVASDEEKAEACGFAQCQWEGTSCTRQPMDAGAGERVAGTGDRHEQSALMGELMTKVKDLELKRSSERTAQKPQLSTNTETCDMVQKGVNWDTLEKSLRIAVNRFGRNYCYSIEALNEYWEQPGVGHGRDPENPDEKFPTDFMASYNTRFNFLFEKCKVKMMGMMADGCS